MQISKMKAMKLQSFAHYMNLISPRHGAVQVFSDFLEMTVCALQLGEAEIRYSQLIKRYDRSDMEAFSLALAALVNEMTGDGQGLIDVLGEHFMKEISHGHNGQYFTPQPICDMMAGMIRAGGTGRRVADCACGSGRMLLAAAKFDRSLRFYGADITRECAHMTAINLCLNGLFGEVAWMDSLANKFFAGWQVDLHPKGVPYLKEITEDQSYQVLRFSDVKPLEVDKKPSQQQLIFNF